MYGLWQSKKKGMALLLTLSVITLLITAALELNRRVRTALVSTAIARDRLTLTEIAMSGIHVAEAMLIKDKKETHKVDSIQEDWAIPEKIAEVLADIHFEKGKISKLVITDEMGKIQINALVDFPKGRHFNESQKIMWDRFTRLLISQSGLDESLEDIEPTTIINSIKDWLDSGDDDATTGLNGAEADYYEGLEPPYVPANGPFTHIDELRQVKGMKPELFDGAKEQYKMPDFITVHGMIKAPNTVENRNYTFPGKININTAELPVLIALVSSENADHAQAIYDYLHEMEDGKFVNTGLTSPAWYKNVPDIPDDVVIDPKLIITSSDIFRIVSEAELNGNKQSVTAVVHREKAKKTGKWICRVLTLQVD